ncbi:MAG: hypothetical protein JNL04_02265 [Rhodospirillaceae bacterium]|nr:hypothetical protein [Rhodospirillaceae bacterium]
MTDEEFLAALEDTSLPDSDFRHPDHLRAAYLYLRRDGFTQAVANMSAALRGFAASRGKAERYHETVTIAFLALINERLASSGDPGSFDAFIARHPEIAERDLLSRYYRPETLASENARRSFVLEPRA